MNMTSWMLTGMQKVSKTATFHINRIHINFVKRRLFNKKSQTLCVRVYMYVYVYVCMLVSMNLSRSDKKYFS